MRDSLRTRILLWYTVVLTMVIAVFGSTVCYLYWRSMRQELDAELQSRAESVAQALRPATAGAFDLNLPDEALRLFYQQQGGPYYGIWTASGEVIDRSAPDLEIPRPNGPGPRSRAGLREFTLETSGGSTVLVGRDMAEIGRQLWSLAATLAWVGALALGLSLAGGWFLASRALAPVARMSATAVSMAGGDLSARIPIERTESELGQLGVALNSAFDRQQDALERQRRFTADASHELRTPLAILTAEAEWASARERTPDEYRESFDACRRAALRMRAVVEGLLTLARADAGDLRLRLVPLDIDELARDVAQMVRPLAEEKQIVIRTTGDAVRVPADPDCLRQVVTNLMSNAIQYNRPGGEITLACWQDDGSAYLRVADTGLGIPPEDVPRVFDRFYRADKARARGGAGLGLAVAKWMVESHGGSISCTSDVGRGTEFLVRLPVQRGGSA